MHIYLTMLHEKNCHTSLQTTAAVQSLSAKHAQVTQSLRYVCYRIAVSLTGIIRENNGAREGGVVTVGLLICKAMEEELCCASLKIQIIYYRLWIR